MWNLKNYLNKIKRTFKRDLYRTNQPIYSPIKKRVYSRTDQKVKLKVLSYKSQFINAFEGLITPSKVIRDLRLFGISLKFSDILGWFFLINRNFSGEVQGIFKSNLLLEFIYSFPTSYLRHPDVQNIFSGSRVWSLRIISTNLITS